jgi:hypothetical protein
MVISSYTLKKSNIINKLYKQITQKSVDTQGIFQ